MSLPLISLFCIMAVIAIYLEWKCPFPEYLTRRSIVRRLGEANASHQPSIEGISNRICFVDLLFFTFASQFSCRHLFYSVRNKKTQHEIDNSQLRIGCHDEEEWNIVRTSLRMLAGRCVRCARIFMAVTHNLPWNAKRNRTPWLFGVHTLVLWKAKSIYGAAMELRTMPSFVRANCKLERLGWVLEWESGNAGTPWRDFDELKIWKIKLCLESSRGEHQYTELVLWTFWTF